MNENDREKNGENEREKNKEQDCGNGKIREQLQGKNTIEAALFLALEFVCRFGEDWGNVSNLASQLLPRGRASTWAMLDRNINLFCKRFYSTWEADEDKLAFFDEVRFLLQSLPMKRDYKIDPEKYKSKLSSPEFAAEYFVSSQLSGSVSVNL